MGKHTRRKNRKSNKKIRKTRKHVKIMKGGQDYHLLSWIDENRLTPNISSNVNEYIVDYLIKHPDKINGILLITNPSALPLLKANPERLNGFEYLLLDNPNPEAITLIEDLTKINLYSLAKNPSTIDLIKEIINKPWWSRNSEHIKKIWESLPLNPNAIDLIKANLNKLNTTSWQKLALNPNAIDLLSENLDKLNNTGWKNLSSNPNAIQLIEANLDKINWNSLALNPNAIHLLSENLNELNNEGWSNLSSNPKAIHILEVNQDKVDWNALSKNPAIFEDDEPVLK
jgi:hypothetical protein